MGLLALIPVCPLPCPFATAPNRKWDGTTTQHNVCQLDTTNKLMPSTWYMAVVLNSAVQREVHVFQVVRAQAQSGTRSAMSVTM